VNDQASSMLVSGFYRRLGEVSKAKALQQAQLAALKDARYRHPNYWSAFLLIGHWLRALDAQLQEAPASLIRHYAR